MQVTHTPQPFISLAQNYIALLSRFSMSPEVVSQTMSPAQPLPKQGVASAHAGSGALAELMQGMTRNYATFLTELAQSSMTMLAQSQSAMLEKAPERSSTLTSSSSARGRRAR